MTRYRIMTKFDGKAIWPQLIASLALVVLVVFVYADVSGELNAARKRELETWDLRTERTKLNLEAFTKYYRISQGERS